MKKVESFVPFWNFRDEPTTVGYLQSVIDLTINGKEQTACVFRDADGDDFLIGSGQIVYMAERGKIVQGSCYMIKFVGQKKVGTMNYNNFEVMLLEHTDPEYFE